MTISPIVNKDSPYHYYFYKFLCPIQGLLPISSRRVDSPCNGELLFEFQVDPLNGVEGKAVKPKQANQKVKLCQTVAQHPPTKTLSIYKLYTFQEILPKL